MRATFLLTSLFDADSGRNEEKDCICARCPSYPDCAIDPELRLFCMSERAPCQVQRRGCMCPGFKVHTRLHFTRDYYWAIGTEKEQAPSNQ